MIKIQTYLCIAAAMQRYDANTNWSFVVNIYKISFTGVEIIL